MNNFIFEQVKKICFAKTGRIIVLFTQKFVIKLSKIWACDPGSRVKKASDPESATLVKKHAMQIHVAGR